MKRQSSDNGGWDKVKAPRVDEGGEGEVKEKEKANFGLSGMLGEDKSAGKTYNGVLLKWSEPADAQTPLDARWRIYVFDGQGETEQEPVETIVLKNQSAFLVGRDGKVADLVLNDSSVSKQHAVIQFRLKQKDGKAFIRPYVIDLESTNGTTVNGDSVEASRYYELLDKDVVRFGECPKEYVVMKAKKAKKPE